MSSTWGGSAPSAATGTAVGAPGRPSSWALAAALLLAGCLHAQPGAERPAAAPPARPVELAAAPCRLSPPPAPLRSISMKPPSCTEWAACLDLANAVALGEYLEAIRAWSRDAFARCGGRQ